MNIKDQMKKIEEELKRYGIPTVKGIPYDLPTVYINDPADFIKSVILHMAQANEAAIVIVFKYRNSFCYIHEGVAYVYEVPLDARVGTTD